MNNSKPKGCCNETYDSCTKTMEGAQSQLGSRCLDTRRSLGDIFPTKAQIEGIKDNYNS